MFDFGEIPKEIKNSLTPRKRKNLNKLERDKIKSKFNHRCAYCGVELNNKFHIDHVYSFYRGGDCDFENLFPSCIQCNLYKATCTIEQFRELISTQHDLALRNSVNYRNLVRFGLVDIKKDKVKFYFEDFKD